MVMLLVLLSFLFLLSLLLPLLLLGKKDEAVDETAMTMLLAQLLLSRSLLQLMSLL